ncbi:hypothetical protein AtubIFM55763_001637 [Aspergillus tubingensis]|uniref:Uncharacterized protein n=2 Tax=Aspergillus subgen. Circumdati TaxID=2720871 RepID=A0A100I4X7_ASPNG|nr:uncharacterized protein AtWU_06025 [Aspergillus tubingensis]GAQ34757.1 hypothetical protein AKAW_00414 [Aspergillus niger]GFN16224.1 hypothetical protein AtWU_06025 [Aspergillus tubingensis]GLA60514.1 hypothetical protein AtubIFM54640_000993 [Aspergillus tubingensis]GLA71268.1 hypothetical protein AtubIFM55763_001637 [Aspergillus tubingensis]GLA85792.1 hypothetical protein AtubIFM56815_010034 [Aspergillus tubingensis]
MEQPEMSQPATHRQDDSHPVTAYFPNPTPTVPAAAAHPPPHILPSHSSPSPHHYHSEVDSSPSEFHYLDDSHHISHPEYQQPQRHSRRQHSLSHQTPQTGEHLYPDLGQASVPPEASVASPYHENGSVLSRASGASEVGRKEGRVRGSWTDHSSYMSGDNHPNGASRVHKRAIHDDDIAPEEEPDALLMLFRLSIPVPVFSFCASLYTIFGVLFVLLVSPLRICSCIPYFRATSFRAQLCGLLVPQLHIHERLVCLRQSSSRSSSTQPIYDPEGSYVAESIDSYSIGGLLTVLLLSPFLSIAITLLAWIAAFFWIFAMVLGNPDGTERKDDGRAAVLGVCRWWQIWLGKARKPLA